MAVLIEKKKQFCLLLLFLTVTIMSVWLHLQPINLQQHSPTISTANSLHLRFN